MTDPTLPGKGAEDVASRAALRAERLRREQAMLSETDSAAEAQLARALKQQQNWSQGAEGERLVAHTLGALERYGWTLLHDVRQPGRQKANIDHIAVGPGGVVVIDAKNWTGTVTTADGVLRQNGNARTREIEAVADQAAAVTALLTPERRTAVRGVLALVAHDVEPVDVGPTLVLGRAALGPWLLSLPARFTPFDVVAVARMLERELASPSGTKPRGPKPRGARTHGRTQQAPPEPATRRRLPRPLRLLIAAALGLGAFTLFANYGPQLLTWFGEWFASLITAGQS